MTQLSTVDPAGPVSSIRYLQATGLADGASLRSESLDGVEHLVIPVIALFGGAVVFPMGAEGYELVPAEELYASQESWNGRPVTIDHPTSGSANDPRTLSAQCFGSIFYTRFANNKLKMEAWLDPLKAARLGGDAQRVIARIQNGEMVEVSVGARIAPVARQGSAGGKEYRVMWTEIEGDHLAMLPEGVKGACSNEMGCGAPRAAQRSHSDNAGSSSSPAKSTGNVVYSDTEERKVDEDKKSPLSTPSAPTPRAARSGLLSRVLAVLTGERDDARAAEDQGVTELWSHIWDALRATEPGFEGIVELYADDQTVIYSAYPEDTVLLLRRSYTVDDDGTVTLSDDKTEMVMETSYVVKAAAAAPGDKPCTCNKKKVLRNQTGGDKSASATAPNKQEKTMSDVKTELIGRLVALKDGPFGNAEDGKLLAQMSEGTLTALVGKYCADDGESKDKGEGGKAGGGKPTPTPTPNPPQTPNPSPPPTDTVQLQKGEYEDLRAMSDAYKAQQTARKAQLVTQLKGAQKVYAESELAALTVANLEKLAQLAGVETEPVSHQRDYALRGAPGDADSDIYTNPPQPWTNALARKNGTAVSGVKEA